MNPWASRARRWEFLGVLTIVLLLPVVAMAESESLDFVRKDAQKAGPEDFKWAAMARNRDELRRIWDRYNLRGSLPAIGFKNNVAVVAGSGGSSSCPLRLHDLRLNREDERIIVRMYQPDPDGGCTEDWVPRTFTVAVSRTDLKPLRPRDIEVRARRIENPNS